MNAFDYLFFNSANLDKKFVLGPSESAVFKNIYENSIKVARYLNDEIGEKEIVLLISSNSVFFITSYLAILKSGNICVPVSPDLEQKSLDYILSITHCNCVFAADSVVAGLGFPGVLKIGDLGLAEILNRNMRDGVDQTDTPFDVHRPALIMFTSGSTGIPKGVVISHQNIISNTAGIIDGLELSASEIMGVVLPFSYCYGLSLLHTHLRIGGSLVLINSFYFLGSVIKDLQDFKCTGFAGVPSHFQIILRKSQNFVNTKFPHLKYVTQAGGKLHNIFIEEFTKSFPNVKFFVMYGQTEATARLAILPANLLNQKMGSIGKPLLGVTLKIVNEDGEDVEPGQVGEIVARGDNIMKGYFHDKEGTKEAIKNGWLFTGDLAKMDQEGFLFIVGRKKEILKVGGRRVSPKEIEEVILSIPKILDCTIEGVADDVLGEGIKATIVIEAICDEVLLKEQVLKTCHENLVSYKIPQVIQFESRIDVTPSGKKVKR